jgi:hypothetical protein
MPRRRAAAVPVAPGVHVIDANGVYTVDDARQIFRLKQSTIRREVREGRLRVSKRAGRYYLLGEWLLQWIREGELRGRTAAANGEATSR